MTDEIKAKHQLVIDMVKAGKPKSEIEDATGYGRLYINRILCDAKLSTRRYIENHAEEIIKLHEEGNTVQQIAKEVKFSECCVRKFLASKGLYEPKRQTKVEDEEEILLKNAVMAEQRPLSTQCEYKGKKYTDITMMYAGG